MAIMVQWKTLEMEFVFDKTAKIHFGNADHGLFRSYSYLIEGYLPQISNVYGVLYSSWS